MTTITLHPSELAYAFSYAKTADVIGWGRAPFLPGDEPESDPKRWYVDGAARLKAAGRLTDSPERGLSLSDDLTAAVLALVDPALVLLAERKAGDGLQRFTVHFAGNTVLGMSRNADGLFELTRYSELTAATLASVGFLGAGQNPVQAGTRIDSSQEAFADIHRLIRAGQPEEAIAALSALGLSQAEAASVHHAMATPAAAGVLSILYCANNTARVARPFSVMTNADQETWILFPPASLEGPMVLERSSVSALTARVVVDVAAWQKITA